MTTPKTQRSPQEYGGANGSAHPWHKLPRWQKRIHGWVCYQLQSWFALLWPEAADRIMYKTLRDQFEEPNRENDMSDNDKAKIKEGGK
jgi:hypothetical protein